jgi:hypothetical protein
MSVSTEQQNDESHYDDNCIEHEKTTVPPSDERINGLGAHGVLANDSLFDGDGTTSDTFTDGLTTDQLEHKKLRPVVYGEIINCADVRMVSGARTSASR